MATKAAPRDSASKPRAPLPANRSRQRAPTMTGASQLNIVSRTLSGVGLKPASAGTGKSRPRHSPAMIRTLPAFICTPFLIVLRLGRIILNNHYSHHQCERAMFDFLKQKKTKEDNTEQSSNVFSRLKHSLTKTRAHFSQGIAQVFLGKKQLNADVLREIENILLSADVGVKTTDQLIQTLSTKLARKELNDTEAALQCLQEEMKQILRPAAQPLVINPAIKPYVILMVGINGSGKTTSIGKLAHYLKPHYPHILLAAGDTFRAAAVQQLQAWGERNQIQTIAQQQNADTAAVIYDALAAAKARDMQILIADTAGRLHTQANLMQELQKIKRVLAKLDPQAPHEVLIVLDASLGQNALNQVEQFNKAIGITGIILSKLDGSAKGGFIFTLAQQTKLPIRFIGTGEKITDLRPFNADEFVEALF
jgi:fused signal recognition particle receptor